MDPIGIGTKGIYVFSNKSWEEDTLQKTEACETGSFQKLRWTWKDVTISENKSSTQILQVHSSQNPSKAPHNSFTLKENLWTKISLWKYVESAHHTLCS